MEQILDPDLADTSSAKDKEAINSAPMDVIFLILLC